MPPSSTITCPSFSSVSTVVLLVESAISILTGFGATVSGREEDSTINFFWSAHNFSNSSSGIVMAARLRMVIVTRIDVTVTMSSTIEDSIILHRRYIAKKKEGKGLLQDPLSTRCLFSMDSNFFYSNFFFLRGSEV